MSLLLVLFILGDLLLFGAVFWAARPRVGLDHGPFRLDERDVNRTRRTGGCPWRSMDSEQLCTRRRGHRGIHDVEPQPLSEVLRRS